MKIKDILTSILLLTASVSVFAAEQTNPQRIIHPEWEYIYYNDFQSGNHYHNIASKYQKCGFTEEKEIDSKTYWLFSMLTEAEEDGTPTEMNMPLAYVREENGRVYMRLHPETPSCTAGYIHPDIYGYRDRELMIYDFNLKTGEGYQIGEPETHPVYNSKPDAESSELVEWMRETEWNNPYSYLFIWDDGRLSVSDIKEDEALGRRVWFMRQKCSYPDLVIYWPKGTSKLPDELDADFETTHARTLRFVEGIGCVRSFLPFPGLYVPTYNTLIGTEAIESSPLLCEITDKTTGEIIYKDERRPDKDVAVERIGAEGENVGAEYYTLQGIRVVNPAPGEICIVRRGAKVTKEVIAR